VKNLLSPLFGNKKHDKIRPMKRKNPKPAILSGNSLNSTTM